ncbi:MAG TPA: AIR synthase-related protein [Rhodanobacteraceae bacterium]|jgi:thiamine-monophosphate kinase|nr:AIR synthase-related protein [Rhodanobacteraceae bacterium]
MNRPEPRVAAGLALRGIAHACIDVSDGLLADLGHVCAASGVGAELAAEALPLSDALRGAFDARACREFALSGGDDYELCFTVPAARAHDITQVFANLELRVSQIGRIVAGSGVRVVDAEGNALDCPQTGWEHFAP